MVYQLAYVSTATGHVERAGLVKLLTTARTRNRAADITGVLVYRHGRFLQLLEGPTPAVAAVFRSIQADQRHTDVQCVQVGHGARRWFSEWSMGFRDLTDEPIAAAGFVNLLTDTAPATASGRAGQRAASSTLYQLWQLLQGDVPLAAAVPPPRFGPKMARRDRFGVPGGPSSRSEPSDGAGPVHPASASETAAVHQDAIRASALASMADSFRRGLLRTGSNGAQDFHPAS